MKIEQLLGGDPQHNAQVTRSLLSGELTGDLAAVREVVALNAAGGLVAYSLSETQIESQVQLDVAFENALQQSFSAIDNGNAAEKLSQWIAASQAG